MMKTFEALSSRFMISLNGFWLVIDRIMIISLSWLVISSKNEPQQQQSKKHAALNRIWKSQALKPEL